MTSNKAPLLCKVLLVLFGLALTSPGAQAQSTDSDMSDLIRPVNPSGGTIPGLSKAMLVEKGSLLFLSGHVPLTADGSVAGSALDLQLRQVFQNIQETLKAANTDFSNVVRLTIYVRDFQPEQLGLIRSVRDEFIDLSQPPASALIGVAALFHEDVRVEVDAVAVVP
ncbi:MAG: RidA family protein [Pseudomonadota bacterium]